MSPGAYQQKLKDEQRERFIAGPPPGQLQAMLSAAQRRRDELHGELELSRRDNTNLKRRLDIAQARLAKARNLLAELDPARFWKERGL